MRVRTPPPLNLSLRDGLALKIANNPEGAHGYGLEAEYARFGVGRKTPPYSDVYKQLKRLRLKEYIKGDTTIIKHSKKGGPPRIVHHTTQKGDEALAIITATAGLLLALSETFDDEIDDLNPLEPPHHPIDMSFGRLLMLLSAKDPSGTSSYGLFNRYSYLGKGIGGSASVDTLETMAKNGLLKDGDPEPSPYGGVRHPYFLEPKGKLTLVLGRPILQEIVSQVVSKPNVQPVAA